MFGNELHGIVFASFPTLNTSSLYSNHNKRHTGHKCAVIRPARPSDLPSLVANEDASRIGGNWPISQISEELYRERATVLVEDKEGIIAGWIVTWHVPPDELHILELAVHPTYRRQGVANSLLAAALGKENRRDAALVLLEVRVSNDAAIGLYEKIGFKAVGRRKKFYSDGESALLMNCDLE